jgi:hypothetical protein
MKQTRLLEIIREEISEALNVLVTNKKGETTTMPFNTPDEKKSVTNLKTDSNITNIETTAGQNIKEEELEEDQLNEMAFALKKGLAPSEKLEPRYKKENFKKVVDLILSKVDGKKTMADVARELGVIQQKIRPVVSDLIDAGILETGEAESKSGKDAVNKPGPKAKAKEEPKAKPSSAPKAEPMDDEDVEAAKAAGSDETAKELGNIASRKDKVVKAYRQFEPELKDKIAQAKSGDKDAVAWLKERTPIIQAYKKAQQVNV